MRWWYFIRDEDDLELASEEYFTDRPLDAIYSENPHTPYYKTYNHIDENHVHVKASNYELAIKKARQLIKEKEHP